MEHFMERFLLRLAQDNRVKRRPSWLPPPGEALSLTHHHGYPQHT